MTASNDVICDILAKWSVSNLKLTMQMRRPRLEVLLNIVLFKLQSKADV